VPNGTFNVSNALNVVVQNITTNKPGTGGQIEPLFQGPNVEGLRGNLQFTTSTLGNCQGVGTTLQAKVYRIIFLYSDTDGTPTPQERTYSITCSTPASAPTTVATGRYHVFNPLSTVPEPETLLLFLTTLGGLGLALHLSGRRRAKRPR
jgi:hypothetical protein